MEPSESELKKDIFKALQLGDEKFLEQIMAKMGVVKDAFIDDDSPDADKRLSILSKMMTSITGASAYLVIGPEDSGKHLFSQNWSVSKPSIKI